MELKKIELLGNQPGPHLLITGGVHGDEFEPMIALRRLSRQLKPESLRGKVTLVPLVNEAAFFRGQRTAEDGLDLARTCPGRADGSVTERTAHAVSELIRTADFYIDLHTGGLLFQIMPLIGYTLHPNPHILGQQRDMAQAFNWPVVWGTDPSLQGRTLSVAKDAGVPAIYAESFSGNFLGIEGGTAEIEGCLNVMARLEMIDRPSPPSRITHVVEDQRPSSGHLQICNPSPADGFFEPAVNVGDLIPPDQLLGCVVDPVGQNPIAIHSPQGGLVLVLRSWPSVRKGDSLAVILELVNSDHA